MGTHLIISTTVDLVRIAPESIIYISSDGNYSTIWQVDGESKVVCLQLGQIENLFAKQFGTNIAGEMFIRIGRSNIVNRSYIYYINPSRQRLELSDCRTFSHTITASKEALKQLKELLERNL